MTNRGFSLAIILVLVFSMCLGEFEANAANQTQVPAPGSPRLSVMNKVPDFFAEGTSGSYSLKITPRGGVLSNGAGSKVMFTPWGYVTAQWTVGTVYIIFLANVTETNFYISFLYLTNSSGSFFMRTFEYQSPGLNTLTFDGSQMVRGKTVATSAVPMPKLKIEPKVQTANALSAMGPELYLNQNFGRATNGSIALQLYPLLTQYFQGETDYNEVWSLIADSLGNFYFGIAYMQNRDTDHVIFEHQVRLNDYQTMNGKKYDAKWIRGTFTNQLTVKLPSLVSNGTIKVNGFPFPTDASGVFTVLVPSGSVIVQAPDELSATSDTRLLFSSWNSYGATNPLTLRFDSTYATLELTANYKSQYRLTVKPGYGDTQISRWYEERANATFTVPAQIALANQSQRVFVRWSGDSNSTSNPAWVTMNSPKQVSATWRTQFQVRIQLTGLPTESKVNVLVNKKTMLVNGSSPASVWVDANAQLAIEVQNSQLSASTRTYDLKGLLIDNQAVASPITVTKPLLLILAYSDTPKSPSSMTLNASPNTVIRGFPINIAGAVSSTSGASTMIAISYSQDQLNWQPLANVSLANGVFAYTWDPGPSISGAYSIRSYWVGDPRHMPTSQVTSLRVLDMSFPGLEPNNIRQLKTDVPFLSSLMTLVGSILILGGIIGAAVLPASSIVMGHLIASLLLGFIFIFPLSATLLVAKALRSRRPTNPLWLTPLVTLWIAALMLVATSGTFIVPQALLEASEMLLFVSTSFLIPVTLSLLLARVVAG